MNEKLEKANDLISRGQLIEALRAVREYRNGRVGRQATQHIDDFEAMLIALRITTALGY